MTRLLIIIPADEVSAARAATAVVFGEHALTEFVPAGSPTGGLPATHWWLAGVFTESQTDAVDGLKGAFPLAHVESYDAISHPSRPLELLAEMGLQRLTPVLNP